MVITFLGQLGAGRLGCSVASTRAEMATEVVAFARLEFADEQGGGGVPEFQRAGAAE
jgi:hypothetical protein